MDPINTTIKDHSKALSDDNKASPSINRLDCQMPYAYQYEETNNSSAFRKSVIGEALPNDEQIYEDPGHKKEEIYSWFKKKKFQKLKISSIRYVSVFSLLTDIFT